MWIILDEGYVLQSSGLLRLDLLMKVGEDQVELGAIVDHHESKQSVRESLQTRSGFQELVIIVVEPPWIYSLEKTFTVNGDYNDHHIWQNVENHEERLKQVVVRVFILFNHYPRKEVDEHREHVDEEEGGQAGGNDVHPVDALGVGGDHDDQGAQCSHYATITRNLTCGADSKTKQKHDFEIRALSLLRNRLPLDGENVLLLEENVTHSSQGRVVLLANSVHVPEGAGGSSRKEENYKDHEPLVLESVRVQLNLSLANGKLMLQILLRFCITLKNQLVWRLYGEFWIVKIDWIFLH